MQRVVEPELLDDDLGTAEEVAASLADLRRINRWFGGISTTLDLVARIAQSQRRARLSLLDVAAGSGDVVLATRGRMDARGVQLDLTLLDRRLSHLPTTSGNGRRDAASYASTTRLVVADALALPFENAAFDLVSCSLFIHHLEPPEVICFAAEALRVCRLAVLINDLRRSALSLFLVRVGFPLMRSPLSRRDGVASVRRAYTLEEMRTMLAETPAACVEVTPHYLFRMGVIAWKNI